jgi:hypothetical protein
MNGRTHRTRLRIPVAPVASALLLAVALVVGLTAVSGVPLTEAAGPTKAPVLIGTRIKLSGPTEVKIGTSPTVNATLTTTGGVAIPVARMTMEINGTLARASRTDSTGLIVFSPPSEYFNTAGTLNIHVVFAGDSTRAASSASMVMTVQPATIQVVTVPAVAGLTIGLGTQQTLTDAQGIATFIVPSIGNLRLLPTFDLPADTGQRVSFVRWEDDVFDPGRTIAVAGDAKYVLGLRIAVRSRIQFVDPEGQPVDPSIVTSVLIETSAGPARTLTSYDDVWLEAEVPVKRTFGLVAVPNQHRISDVEIAGTNVVNRGQQVWEPTLNGTFTVEVLLYHLNVRIDDALLGSPLHTNVTLEYPDGSQQTQATDAGGNVAFNSLPRGDYTILVHAKGIVPPAPIAMSKPQSTTIRIITSLDLSIGGGLLVGMVVLLILLGRRHQVVALARASRSVTGGALARIDPMLGRLEPVAELADRIVSPVLGGADAMLRRVAALSPPAGRPRAAGGGAFAARTTAVFGSVDGLIRSVSANPLRRVVLVVVGLVVMGLVVAAIAATLVGASPGP